MFDDDEREQLPLEAREIHQRLVSDSSHWARGLLADTRIAEFARTLPQRMPSPSAQRTRNVRAHRGPSSTVPDMMSIKGQTGMFKNQRPGRTCAASIAAVAVVALIVGVLYTMHSVQGIRAGSGGSRGNNTVVVPTPTPHLQGDYSATPGPLASYVSKLYTAGDRPSDGTPVNVKSHFVVGHWVYVSAIVHGLPKGAHTISIRWYLNGVFVELPASAQTSQTDGDKRLVFSLQYPEPGAGMAKVYIDRPASDTSESPSDPYLAGTVVFVVEMPQPTPQTTPQTTPQPGGPMPTATSAPGA
jgi:hypothetical protein